MTLVRYASALVRCSTTGCMRPGTILCRYPVKRHGRDVCCNRMVCKTCASADRYCPPHSRGLASGKVDPLVTICSACFMQSCPAGEMRCDRPAAPRQVTVAQWRKLISFGVLT